MKTIFSNQKAMKGQALVALLSFIIISITVVSAAVIILITNSLAASKVEQGVTAYALAQSGVENAVLRLLRNPTYTGEPPMIVPLGTIVISVVSGGGSYTIYSTGKVGKFARRIRAIASFDAAEKLNITEWKEL